MPDTATHGVKSPHPEVPMLVLPRYPALILFMLPACTSTAPKLEDSSESAIDTDTDTDAYTYTGTDTNTGTDTDTRVDTDRCMVGYWPLDDGSGSIAADQSGGGNDGALQGDATWTVGAVGGAIELDGGGDFLNMGDVLNLGLPVTVSAWVWIKGDGNFALVNTDVDDASYLGVWLQVSPDDTFSASFGDGTGGNGSQYRRSATSSDAVPRDAWIHLAAVIRDAEDMTLYVNGTPVPAWYDGSGGRLATSGAPFHVGNMLSAGRTTDARGIIDELRVHDCALMPEEIAAYAAR